MSENTQINVESLTAQIGALQIEGVKLDELAVTSIANVAHGYHQTNKATLANRLAWGTTIAQMHQRTEIPLAQIHKIMKSAFALTGNKYGESTFRQAVQAAQVDMHSVGIIENYDGGMLQWLIESQRMSAELFNKFSKFERKGVINDAYKDILMPLVTVSDEPAAVLATQKQVFDAIGNWVSDVAYNTCVEAKKKILLEGGGLTNEEAQEKAEELVDEEIAFKENDKHDKDTICKKIRSGELDINLLKDASGLAIGEHVYGQNGEFTFTTDMDSATAMRDIVVAAKGDSFKKANAHDCFLALLNIVREQSARLAEVDEAAAKAVTPKRAAKKKAAKKPEAKKTVARKKNDSAEWEDSASSFSDLEDLVAGTVTLGDVIGDAVLRDLN